MAKLSARGRNVLETAKDSYGGTYKLCEKVTAKGSAFEILRKFSVDSSYSILPTKLKDEKNVRELFNRMTNK